MTQLRLLSVALTCLLLWSLPGYAAPTLSVRGEGSLEVPADLVQFSVGVRTEAPTAAEALQQNSTALEAARAALLKAGLPPEALQTNRFSLSPVWEMTPGPSSERVRTLTGYRAVNSLELRTTALETVGELIAAATAAGANDIGQLNFSLADEGMFRAEVIRLATDAARRDARALAEASAHRLGELQSAELDQAETQNRSIRMVQMAQREGGTTPPIEPGRIRLDARVHLVYEIHPLED